MSPTLPPSFPVEKQKERLRVFNANSELKKEVSKVVNRVFSNCNNPEAMSLLKGVKKILWRPNNYRLKIPIKKGSKGNFTSLYPSLGLFPVETKGRGMKVLKVNSQITLLIQPNSVTGIYSLKNSAGGKEWYEVVLSDEKAFIGWLDDKVKGIEQLLRLEIAKLGLELDYSAAVWIRHEDGIKNEEFLSSLSPELVIHDTYFKKVYKEEVEFKSPEYVKNYITNRAIERVSPEISKELAEILSLLKVGTKNDETQRGEAGVQFALSVSPSASFSEFLCVKCGWNLVYCGCKEPVVKSALLEGVLK